jgi:hypothetical protein
MGATPILAIPYPESTDPADGPLGFRNLAERVELLLKAQTFIGNEGALLGSPPAAGTLKDFRQMSTVTSIDGTGRIAVNFTPAFAHGIVSFLGIVGDFTGQTSVASVPTPSSLGFMWMQVFTGANVSAGGGGIRVNWWAVGW